LKVKLVDDIFFKNVLLSLYKISNKSFIGEFKSAFKGLGLDFYQNRLFTENDSIKNINWNLFAKFRTLYVKEYIEDRNRFNLIAVDISPSMFQSFDNKTKIRKALEVSLIILYSSLKSNDNTSLVLFDDKIRYFFPFNRKFNYFFTILNTLKSISIDLHSASYPDLFFENLHNILKKRTQIFLISDFVFEINYGLLSYLGEKHNLTSIIIEDNEELLLSQNLKHFSSLENADIFQQIPYYIILENSIKSLQKANNDILFIKTDENPIFTLQKFFENKIVKQ